MTTQHTPGPWHTTRDGFSTVYVEARIGGGWIQEVAACGPTEKGSDQQEANARLISAAPELLEAIKPFAAMLADHHKDVPDYQQIFGINRNSFSVGDLRRAVSAIAKATGSQP